MFAPGLSALAGGVHSQRLIPVCGIENLAIAGARHLFERIVEVFGGVDRVLVAGARHGPEIKAGSGIRRVIERMAETHSVQLPPSPLRGMGALQFGESCRGAFQTVR